MNLHKMPHCLCLFMAFQCTANLSALEEKEASVLLETLAIYQDGVIEASVSEADVLKLPALVGRATDASGPLPVNSIVTRAMEWIQTNKRWKLKHNMEIALPIKDEPKSPNDPLGPLENYRLEDLQWIFEEMVVREIDLAKTRNNRKAGSRI